MKHINTLAVVGGGSAGLVAALIIKTKFPHINLDVIRSKKIGIIGVGEGSTEHWSDFMNFVQIDPVEIIRECDATFKSGIMFEGWSKDTYLQSIMARVNGYEKNYPYVYSHLIANNATPQELVSDHAWNSKVNTWFIGQENPSSTVQFHFNTNKLNDYLTKKCIERGINIVDDEIVDVKIDTVNNINELIGENKKYNYDFYIDSTGFRRILIDKLGAKWQSYRKYLKMKSAIVFPSKYDSDIIPMWTRSKALDYGWMFTIPVWDRTGNGYIFDSDYISADQAHQELEVLFNKKIDISKQINFDPGTLDNPWINNCCAIGLSASFVEPLEASSIGTSIQQVFLLCEKLINYNQSTINSYNHTMSLVLDNIRDFIALHYVTNKQTSDFWKDLKLIDLPDSLGEKLDRWQHQLPTADDFKGSSFFLFNAFHHILVLHGLGLFNIESIKKEYRLMVSDDKKQEARFIVDNEKNLRCQTIPHKVMLDVIRNLKNENYQ